MAGWRELAIRIRVMGGRRSYRMNIALLKRKVEEVAADSKAAMLDCCTT